MATGHEQAIPLSDVQPVAVRRADLAVSNWVLPLLVVVPMLVLARALGTSAIIFPEGAALAMGIWSLSLPGWAASRVRIAALPPLCAAMGTALVRSEMPLHLAVIVGAALALLVLQVADSRLLPALSAAVLPIVFGVDEASYPLAVLGTCVVIAGLMPWLSRRRPRSPMVADASGRYPWPVVAAAMAPIAAWTLLGGTLLALPVAALAPPLFVSALEWLGHRTCTLRGALRRWALLVAAAVAGGLAGTLFVTPWVAGAVAVGLTLMAMWLLVAPHPPALAIALIPQLQHAGGPVDYALAITCGAVAVYLGVLAVHCLLRPPVAPPVHAASAA